MAVKTKRPTPARVHSFIRLDGEDELNLMMGRDSARFYLMTEVTSADGLAEIHRRRAEANDAKAQAALEALASKPEPDPERELTGADEAMASYLTGDDATEE
ncbi:hypothetical protein [Glycomyces sp. NPDC021274]|uniref:hypothetical protein n=1 Tax=Glycomyces sp. NPDC021274 TaxID=3155120 RepID=UPI0033D888EB